MRLSNPGDDALWVRLCAEDHDPCRPLRHVYVAPRHSYLMERVTAGRYHVIYTQITGQNLAGVSPAFRIHKDQESLDTLLLSEFQQKP